MKSVHLLGDVILHDLMIEIIPDGDMAQDGGAVGLRSYFSLFASHSIRHLTEREKAATIRYCPQNNLE